MTPSRRSGTEGWTIARRTAVAPQRFTAPRRSGGHAPASAARDRWRPRGCALRGRGAACRRADPAEVAVRRSIAAAACTVACLLALPAGALARAHVPVEVVPAPSAPFTVATTWGDEGYGPGQFGTGREKWGGDRQFDDPGGIAVG